jgi:hypothetical protein
MVHSKGAHAEKMATRHVMKRQNGSTSSRLLAKSEPLMLFRYSSLPRYKQMVLMDHIDSIVYPNSGRVILGKAGN